MTKSSLSGQTDLEYRNKEQRDVSVRLKCVLIKSDCWIKLVLTSEFCIAFYSTDQNYIQNRQLSVCQGYFTCIYIEFWQGPFPKSGLDKVWVFPIIRFGSFYYIKSFCVI